MKTICLLCPEASSIAQKGTDKLTNSATGTWECHASFGLNTRSEWALVSTFRALQSPSSSASPRLRVNLSVPDCGMLTFEDADLKHQILDETGIMPPFAMEAFSDLDADVRQSIAQIKANPYVPFKDQIRGFVYETESGRLRGVT